jgi:hypothetical protein
MKVISILLFVSGVISLALIGTESKAQDCGGVAEYYYDKVEKHKRFTITVRNAAINSGFVSFTFVKSSKYSEPYLIVNKDATELGCYHKTSKAIVLYTDGTNETHKYSGGLECGDEPFIMDIDKPFKMDVEIFRVYGEKDYSDLKLLLSAQSNVFKASKCIAKSWSELEVVLKNQQEQDSLIQIEKERVLREELEIKRKQQLEKRRLDSIAEINKAREKAERIKAETIFEATSESWVVNFDVAKLSEAEILNRQDFIGVPKALEIQWALTRALRKKWTSKQRNCTCTVIKQTNGTKTKFKYVITNCKDSKSRYLFNDNSAEVERTSEFDVK